MEDILNTLQFYFTYPFVRYALVVGTLIALCSSLLGVVLVLRRYSFIGDSLSHVAFGAMAAAMITGMGAGNNILIVMPVTVVVAILLLRNTESDKMSADAKIAMISVGSLAIGYLIINVFSQSANVSADVCSTLFGATSILTLSKTDMWVCIVIAAIVIVSFILFYNRIFAVTFDETFARATGRNTRLYNLIISVIIALIISISMNLVGSLLISAFIIFPAMSAMRILNNFRAVVICSAVLSVICAVIGILISILVSTPVGSTIVVCNIIVFVICYVVGLRR